MLDIVLDQSETAILQYLNGFKFLNTVIVVIVFFQFIAIECLVMNDPTRLGYGFITMDDF